MSIAVFFSEQHSATDARVTQTNPLLNKKRIFFIWEDFIAFFCHRQDFSNLTVNNTGEGGSGGVGWLGWCGCPISKQNT
jgi:hypothetical protein